MQSHGEFSECDLTATIDRQAAASFRPTGWALVLLGAGLSLGYSLRLPPDQARTLIALAGASAGLLLLVLALHRYWPAVASRAQLATTGMMALVGVNCLVYLHIAGQPADTATLALFLVAAGSLVLSTPWFLGITIVSVAGWGILMAQSIQVDEWPHYSFALAGAMGLAIGVHMLRLNAVRREMEAQARDDAQDAALRRSEERYRKLTEESRDAIWTLDARGCYEYISPAIEGLLGYPPERSIGRHLSQSSLTPESMEQALDLLERARSGEFDDATLEAEYVAANGRKIWTEISVHVLRNDDGSFAGIHAVTRDVDRRKRVEEKLRATELRLATTFQRAQLGMVLIDATGYFVEVNPAFCKMLGYEEQELLSMQAVDVVHPTEQDEVVVTGGEGLAGAMPTWSGPRQMVSKTGDLLATQIEATVVREEGSPTYFLGIVEDQTEKRRVEEVLQRSEEQFRALFDQVAIGVTLCDSEVRFVAANPAFCAMIGYSEEELLAKTILEVVHPDDRVSLVGGGQRAIDGHTAKTSRSYSRSDGSVLRTNVTTTVLKRSDGAVQFLGLVEEVDSLYRFDSELSRARVQAESAERARSTFLATISHEIRTPLNAVIGMTGLLLDTELSNDQRRHAETARTAGEALLSLINQILDYSKLESETTRLELTAVDPYRLVDEVAQLTRESAAKKGLAFIEEVDADVPDELFGDYERLRQVLVNLVSNAIKFTESGYVRVRLSTRPVPEASTIGCRLRMEVSDSGLGVPPDQRIRIFEPFAQVDQSSTRRTGGTGLGLSICRELAERMGGEVGIEDQLEDGSTFFAEVPVLLASEVTASVNLGDPQESEEEAPAQPLQRSRVLIAEDDPASRSLAIQLVRKLGLDSDCVASGIEAVDAARSAPYSAVLMDCQMPEMDGFEATRRLRTLPLSETTPVIAMTASVMRGDRERCLAAGMNDYVSKPVRLEELCEALLRCGVLESRSSGADRSPLPG